MGLANFGYAAGGYTGTALLYALGGVEPPAFANLRLLVVLRSLARLLPLTFIPLLVPLGSPRDAAFDLGGGGGGGGDGVSLAAVARGSGADDGAAVRGVSDADAATVEAKPARAEAPPPASSTTDTRVCQCASTTF